MPFTAPGGVPGTAPMGPQQAASSQRLEHLPEMVNGVMSVDPMMQLEATTQFRKLLSIEKNPPIQAVINAGVVPRFIEFLQVGTFVVLIFAVLCQLFSLWVLAGFSCCASLSSVLTTQPSNSKLLGL